MTEIIGQERSVVRRSYPSALLGSTALTLSLIAGVALPVQHAFAQQFVAPDQTRVLSMGARAQESPIIVGPGETQTVSDQTIDASGVQSGIRVNGPDSFFTGNNLTVNVEATGATTGSPAAGVYATQGEAVTSNSTFNISGTQAYGLLSSGGAGRNTFIGSTDDTIVTSGDFGWAVFAYSPLDGSGSGTIDLYGTLITTSGEYGYGLLSQESNSVINAADISVSTSETWGLGAYASYGGTINLSDSSILTSGNSASGVYAAYEGSHLNIVASTIETRGNAAAGARAFGGSVDIHDSNIVTYGEAAHGVHASDGGKITITGGTIDTAGSRAYGLYSTGADSAITANEVAISTSSDWTFGAYATDEGTITLDGGSISTEGARAYGILASTGGTVTSNANVTTTGAGAHGVQAGENTAGDGGTVNLTGGTISTGGNDAFGLHALSTATISATGDVVIRTTGVNGFGAFVESDSSIHLDGTTVRTTGENGFGLLVNNDESTTGGIITANNVDVHTTGAGAQAVRIENGGKMTISNSRLAAQNAAGIALVNDATVTLNHTEISSSQETISSTLNQNDQIQAINIGDGTVATTNSGTLLSVTRSGDGSTGVVNLNLGAGSTTQGDIVDEGTKTTGGTDVTLEEGASWSGLLKGVRSFLSLQGGEVNFEGEAIIAGDLSGEGTTFTFSEQGGQIGGDVALTQGSSTTGGSISTPITVVGGVAVDATSVFGGNWNIGGDLDSSGVVTPGNSIGVINVAGNLTFAPTSLYEVELNAAGEADRINVVGTASLDGAVTVAPIDYFRLDYDYTILTADAGFAGTSFDSIELVDDYAFITPVLVQDDTAGIVAVRVERNGVGYASVAETENQAAVAAAVDTLPLGSEIGGVLAVTTVAEARGAFEQLSGEAYASAQTALVDASHVTTGVINTRIRQSSGQPDTGTGVWMSGYGASADLDGNGNAADVDYSSGGLLIGADGQFTPDIFAGVVAGYGRTDIEAGYASSINSDNYLLGLYGGTNWGNVAFRGGLINTWHDLDAERGVGFASFADALDASYNARTFQAFGELGYGIEMGDARFEPFVNLSHVRHSSDGFTESGGASALAVDGASLNTTFTTIGLRASTELTAGNLPVSLHGMVGWRHAFGDVTPDIDAGFAGADGFSVDGTALARDVAVIEAGLDLNLNPASGPGVAKLGVTYSGAFGDNTSSHGVRLGLNVKF